MTGFLIDTSTLSLLAPGRAPLAERDSAALRRRSRDLYLSTITLAEIHAGIAKLRRAGAVRRADDLTSWLDRLDGHFADRVLSFDKAAAVQAGVIGDAALALGRHPGFADVAIAATAAAHGLVVVTENLRHFQPLGVRFSSLSMLE